MSPLDQQLFFGFNSCLEYDAVIYQEKKNEEICQCNGEKLQAMNLGLLSTHFKRIIAKWKKMKPRHTHVTLVMKSLLVDLFQNMYFFPMEVRD